MLVKSISLQFLESSSSSQLSMTVVIQYSLLTILYYVAYVRMPIIFTNWSRIISTSYQIKVQPQLPVIISLYQPLYCSNGTSKRKILYISRAYCGFGFGRIPFCSSSFKQHQFIQIGQQYLRIVVLRRSKTRVRPWGGQLT